MMKKILSLGVVIGFLGGCGSLEGEKIKLGFLAPMSGDASIYGEVLKNATLMALDDLDLNDKMEVIWEDSKCLNKEAVTAFQKLVNLDGVKIILGDECSGGVLAVAPLAKENGTLLFSVAASSPEISGIGSHVFRMTTSDAANAKLAANSIMRDFGHEKIGVITEMTDYAEAFREEFENEWGKLEGEILVDEEFLTEGVDISSQVTKMKEGDLGAILVVAQSSRTGGLVVRKLKEQGVKAEIFGSGAVDGNEAFEVAGDLMEGVILWHPIVDESRPEVQEFLQEFEERFGQKPIIPILATAGFDRMVILKRALEECGGETECVKNWLSEMKEFEGLSGRVTFDEKGDAQFEFSPLIAHDGKFEILK